jgi:hypothetical protein
VGATAKQRARMYGHNAYYDLFFSTGIIHISCHLLWELSFCSNPFRCIPKKKNFKPAEEKTRKENYLNKHLPPNTASPLRIYKKPTRTKSSNIIPSTRTSSLRTSLDRSFQQLFMSEEICHQCYCSISNEDKES